MLTSSDAEACAARGHPPYGEPYPDAPGPLYEECFCRAVAYRDGKQVLGPEPGDDEEGG